MAGVVQCGMWRPWPLYIYSILEAVRLQPQRQSYFEEREQINRYGHIIILKSWEVWKLGGEKNNERMHTTTKKIAPEASVFLIISFSQEAFRGDWSVEYSRYRFLPWFIENKREKHPHYPLPLTEANYPLKGVTPSCMLSAHYHKPSSPRFVTFRQLSYQPLFRYRQCAELMQQHTA